MKRNRICATVALLGAVLACSDQAPPAPRPSLAGTWRVVGGSTPYSDATIELFEIEVFGFPPTTPDTLIAGTASFEFIPSGNSSVAAVTGKLRNDGPGVVLHTDSVVRITVYQLQESSETKENCDGDNSIDPNEPLCLIFGVTSFNGVLNADGSIVGAFSDSACSGQPTPLFVCESLTLSGTATFRRQ